MKPAAAAARRAAWLMPLAAVFLGGCSLFGGDISNLPPPTPLEPLEQAQTVKTLWQTTVPDGAEQAYLRLTPAVRGGSLYVAGAAGTVQARDLASGELRWSSDVQAPITGGVGLAPERVLVGTGEGEVLALATEDGSPAWRVRVPSEVLSPPQFGMGTVVVRTVSGHVIGLGLEDGQELWRFRRDLPALTLRGTGAPLIVQQAVIVGLDDGRLAVLDARTGRLYWERTVAPPRGRSELERMVDVDAQPDLLGRALYAVSYQGRVVAVNVENGEGLWEREMSAYAGLTATPRGVFVSDAEGVVWALDPRSGRALWRHEKLKHRDPTAPVVAGDKLVIADGQGWLHWLDPVDGSLVARVRLTEAAVAAAPTAADGVLYALAEDGALGAFRLP